MSEKENELIRALAYKTMYLESKRPIEWIDIREKPSWNSFYFVKVKAKRLEFYVAYYDEKSHWAAYIYTKKFHKVITHWSTITLPII